MEGKSSVSGCESMSPGSCPASEEDIIEIASEVAKLSIVSLIEDESACTKSTGVRQSELILRGPLRGIFGL